MPGVRMQILWIFLRSKMELFWYIYLFIYLLLCIFYLAVLTPKTTFQTVQNHLPYQASIFG